MQGKQLYDYAVIRVVPRVEREEFVNVGLIMFSKRARFLKVRLWVDEEKLRIFPSEMDMQCLRDSLGAFEKICSGRPEGGPVAALDVPDRFRWLTAVRSASVQTSRPHAGFADDLDTEFDRLFGELVL
ncbi:DUF3037 domain-containing protein [Alistipes sp. OttesenSCG-928-L06]|nr:DUF3037 domain-containing protein [Alistipes sp. OttesenSCG-928-L06]